MFSKGKALHALGWLLILALAMILFLVPDSEVWGAWSFGSPLAPTSTPIPTPTLHPCIVEGRVPCGDVCGPRVIFERFPHRHITLWLGNVKYYFFNCARITDLRCTCPEDGCPDFDAYMGGSHGVSITCIHDQPPTVTPTPTPTIGVPFVSPLQYAVPTSTPAPEGPLPRSGDVNGTWVPVYGLSCDQVWAGGDPGCICFCGADPYCP